MTEPKPTEHDPASGAPIIRDTPEPEVLDAKAEAKKKADEAKNLATVIAPFGATEAELTSFGDLDDSAPVWLTVGNWQVGPTTIGWLRTYKPQAAKDGGEPHKAHDPQPEPEQQKKRA